MTTPIQVLLADDHAVLRSGLRLLINSHAEMTVTGEAGNGLEVIALAKTLQPDVILLDLNMPELDGLGALPQLRVVAPSSRILILTMHDDTRYLQEALKFGASGYVLKKAVDNELVIAIQAVMRGETYVHSAMTQKLIQTVITPNEPKTHDPWKDLSEREFDVMKLVALGYTNQEIAEKVFLSVKTVETYRARGMEKLEISTRAELVKSALKYGHMDE